MDHLKTVVSLTSGSLTRDVLADMLGAVFDEWRWFVPTRYGRATPDTPIPGSRPLVDELIERLGSNHWLAVGSDGDEHVLMLTVADDGEHDHAGAVTWLAPARLGADAAWRDAHATEVADLMRRLGSPYAYASPERDIRSKGRRLVDDDQGFKQQVATVRAPKEGLAAIFWRNFFGRPFRELFGDALADVSRDIDGIALVEPYPDPASAFTEAGRAREAGVITHLGEAAFFDHARQAMPTRRPVL